MALPINSAWDKYGQSIKDMGHVQLWTIPPALAWALLPIAYTLKQKRRKPNNTGVVQSDRLAVNTKTGKKGQEMGHDKSYKTRSGMHVQCIIITLINSEEKMSRRERKKGKQWIIDMIREY